MNSKMQKTFSLQNMETYFSNYISCSEHKKEPITNFCTESPCLKFLCPECIEAHSALHANHAIESIRTCIKKTSQRLRDTIAQLEKATARNAFLKPDAPEQYCKLLIRELEQVKEGLIEQIRAYFRQKEQEIRRQTSRFSETQKKLETLRRDLQQASAEMRMLDKNLLNPQETVKAITKANKLNYNTMLRHFNSRVDEVEEEMSVSVKLEMNSQKREMLRKSLNELVGVRNKDRVEKGEKSRGEKGREKEKGKTSKGSLQQSRQQEKMDRYAKLYQNNFNVNPPPLSADRILQQSSFRIDHPNFFQSQPFLHFFEVTNSTLHLIDISSLRQSQAAHWQTIPLAIDFQIPSFHRTVATEDGNIFVIGGTILDDLRRSKIIYQYDPAKYTLKPVAELAVARSSHSVLCHRGVVYIVGGMTDNDETVRKCEAFYPKTGEIKLIASSKNATTNSCLCSLGGEQLVKLGGVFASGENNDGIEVYNIRSNSWTEVDPTIENVGGEFGLLSCSGWAPLNDSQVFIFGGYNQEADSENSRMSFVLQQNPQDGEFYIKYVNQKNPPFAEGFWNQQGTVHNGLVYCLQNVDGEEGNDCLEDRRNLLLFNGKTWTVCEEAA